MTSCVGDIYSKLNMQYLLWSLFIPTASAFAVTKIFRTSVPIYYFAPQKTRHKPASTKDLELYARSIPQLSGYKITTRIMIINYHVMIPHSAAAAVTAIVESYKLR